MLLKWDARRGLTMKICFFFFFLHSKSNELSPLVQSSHIQVWRIILSPEPGMICTVISQGGIRARMWSRTEIPSIGIWRLHGDEYLDSASGRTRKKVLGIVFHFDQLKFMELISSVSQNVLFPQYHSLLSQIKGLANCCRECDES